MPELTPDGLVYLVPATDRNDRGIRKLLSTHAEIRFVSLVAVDLGGNDTDEKIPVATFLKDAGGFLEGAIQTDGSSVVLPGIATLNDGKVDFITDPSVNWHVDYNWDLTDPGTGRAIGTLRIPSFLMHGGRLVDSRSVLVRAVNYLEERVREFLRIRPQLAESLGFSPDDVAAVLPTAATELEFWVRTPGREAGAEELAASQSLQESYWKRTKGPVRSALEASLVLLEQYGLQPEMGHKEVGGVKARITGEGRLDDVMEQLEIDWRYDDPLQAADNELLARVQIKETFRRHGLEVTFSAKPIAGVAGSGEHTHVGLSVRLRDGRMVNLFTSQQPEREYLSPFGWGALFGLLKHWPLIGGLVTATNDAFNRLQPGFEAPVCPVAAIGPTVQNNTRNRTVLVGLVRDSNRPLSTRFEVRAPNPHTNTYLALAAFYQAMADGMEYAVKSGKSEADFLCEFNKEPGEKADYLPADRAFRSEEDVFEHFTAQERAVRFGRPPATVCETLASLNIESEGRRVLLAGEVFPETILAGYTQAMLAHWRLELRGRIIPSGLALLRSCVPGHNPEDSEAAAAWADVDAQCRALKMNNLLSRIKEALDRGDDVEASELQKEAAAALAALERSYQQYRRWYVTGAAGQSASFK